MPQGLKRFKEQHPFASLILIAICVRIIAVVFVPGFGSHGEVQYPTLFIAFLEKIKALLGIGNSQGMMFLSRSLYAVVSLFTVSIIYRICDLGSNKQNAWLMALIPTFSCIMPSFGIIGNASAFLGLPLMLYGANVLLRQEVLRQNNLYANVHRSSFLIAGIMLGLSVCVWYESVFIVLSIILILFIRRNYKGALMAFIGIVISIAVLGLLLLVLSDNPLKYIYL